MAAITSAVILEPPKIKSDTVCTVSPSISHEVMDPEAMILIFWMLSFKPTFFHVLTIVLVHSCCYNKNTTTLCMHPASLTSPALAGRFFTTSTPWETYKEQKFISHSSASWKSKIRVTAQSDRLQAGFIWCPHPVQGANKFAEVKGFCFLRH